MTHRDKNGKEYAVGQTITKTDMASVWYGTRLKVVEIDPDYRAEIEQTGPKVTLYRVGQIISFTPEKWEIEGVTMFKVGDVVEVIKGYLDTAYGDYKSWRLQLTSVGQKDAVGTVIYRPPGEKRKDKELIFPLEWLAPYTQTTKIAELIVVFKKGLKPDDIENWKSHLADYDAIFRQMYQSGPHDKYVFDAANHLVVSELAQNRHVDHFIWHPVKS